ncbi:MAG: class I SAM-dependent methyltransferase [Lachnospiraceae bacterium]|nr:class I SAM-dependent methyltransferase [Lachnospiraceae bacterium]
MDAYTGFAGIYDRCMDNIPYDEWAQNIGDLLRKYGIAEGIVCELGCGTGEMTERLSAMGYDMIGIDSSEDMLMEAREKLYERAEGEAPDILYLQQDMREMELFGTVAAFVSVCDSMNYLLTKEDLLTVFRLVNNYLDRDGLFLFDMKTEACFAALGDETRVEQYRDATVIWENSYRKRKKQNCYRITMFLKERGNLYEKAEEVHIQQAYSVDTVRELLTEAGMVFVGAVDAATGQPADKTSERILFLAKEGFQPGKCYTEAGTEA